MEVKSKGKLEATYTIIKPEKKEVKKDETKSNKDN